METILRTAVPSVPPRPRQSRERTPSCLLSRRDLRRLVAEMLD